MLILAGVSLNAIIGDNGIITNAQNANIKNGMAILEEWLQEEYVEYYDETEKYSNKPELLASKVNNLFLKNGNLNYVISSMGGTLKEYYLINKNSLPQEIQKSLVGGETTEYSEYVNFINVYGVTKDLKVYYCSNGLIDGIIGNVEGIDISADTPAKKVNSNEAVKNAIANILGIEEGVDVTLQDVQKIKTLELSNITSVEALSEMYSLKNLTLKNCTLNNLNGIENCAMLEKITFYDTVNLDYTKLSLNRNLNSVYLYLSSGIIEETANDQVSKLCLGLNKSNANITQFGISGDYKMLDELAIYNNERDYHLKSTSEIFKYFIDDSNKSNVTNVDSMKELSPTIKSSITNLYLNNNRINEGETENNINSLEDFSKLKIVTLMNNSHLYNLNGLKNHSNIDLLYVYNCYYQEGEVYKGLNDISGLSGLSSLTKLYIMDNLALQSLTGIGGNTNLEKIVAYSCNITDISALSNLTKLTYLSLYSNVNLETISYLSNLKNLNTLYLANNVNMDKTQFVSALDVTGIIEQCGINYSIPDEYKSLLTSILSEYDLSDLNLTDSSDIIQTFVNRTDLSNILKLNLKGNRSLTDTTLQTILGKMTNLKGLSLNGLTNLKSIDFIDEGKAENIIELDLRGTPITDLSNLENYGLKLQALIIDNYNTDFSTFQNTISTTLYNNNSAGRYSCVYNSDLDYTYLCSGLCLTGDGSKYNFSSNCTEITNIFIGTYELRAKQSGTLDLSNLPNLSDFYQRYCKFKIVLPVNLNFYTIRGGLANVDLSRCMNLESVIIDDIEVNENNNPLSTLTKLPKNVSLVRAGPYDLSSFSKIIREKTNEEPEVKMDCSELMTLKLGYYSNANPANITSISGIENATNLQELYLYNSNLSDISDITKVTSLKILEIQYLLGSSVTNIPLSNENGTLSNLEKINIRSNKSFNKITGLGDISSLTQFVIKDTSISDITGLSNNTGLTTVSLYDNLISDLSEFDRLIVNCGGTVSFSSLNLSNNSIDYSSASGNDNVQTILNLYNAGCTNIDISGNNVANSPRLQGIAGIKVK